MVKKHKHSRSILIDQVIRKLDGICATIGVIIAFLILLFKIQFVFFKIEDFTILFYFIFIEFFRFLGWLIGTKLGIYFLSNSEDSVYSLIDNQKIQFNQILESQKTMSDQITIISNKIIKK